MALANVIEGGFCFHNDLVELMDEKLDRWRKLNDMTSGSIDLTWMMLSKYKWLRKQDSDAD